jgi:Ca-activated chloride channel family protein
MKKEIQTVGWLLLAAIGLQMPLQAKQVKLDVSMSKSFLIAEKKQIAHMKVGLTGFEMPAKEVRPPVNVAIVLDRSGSMSGQKIEHAKKAAMKAIDYLGTDDIVSVVAYDHNVRVLVPATKVSDKADIKKRIGSLQSGGNTALFAGVSKGAAEIRKFAHKDRVNRVILLSDGKANSGPSSPKALGDLGASLKKEGISVTTWGLGNGYNEDLMDQLAQRSDGNHTFIESPQQLAGIFEAEFGDILSVVAQEVAIEVKCAPGIRPVKVLNREAEISGQRIFTQLSQIYSLQQKYILLEVEVPATKANQTRKIADVEISYANMLTETTDQISSILSVKFSESQEVVKNSTNEETMTEVVLQRATAANKLATQLRDSGDVKQAKEVLRDNQGYLELNAGLLKSSKLSNYAKEQQVDLESLDDDAKYRLRRKEMRSQQFKNSNQQISY